MKSILNLFYNWLSKNIRNSKYRGIIILGSLFYLLSPLDISPDIFPVLGWLDDGVILTLLLGEVTDFILDYRQRRREKTPEIVKVK